jgi:osmotically-inducible protein OsmY
MATMKKTDSQIHHDVLQELKWDWRVDETEVGVEVDDGVVTLTGTVASWAKRLAAQEAAHRVQGVLDVANDVEVRPLGTPGRTDTEIAHAVRHALDWDVFVPDGIRTTVSEGGVTLAGEVSYASEREAAERAVRNLAGVRQLTNQIAVNPPWPISPAELRKSIEGALERHAEKEAKEIKLDIKGGHVTLSGTVHSWADREAVLDATRATAGVQEIEDNLALRPYAS